MKFLLITLWLCSLQFTPFSFSHAPCTRSICFIYNYSQGTVQRSKERISRKISWILKLFLFTFFFGALQSQCIYYEHSCTYLIPPVYEDKNLFKNTLFFKRENHLKQLYRNLNATNTLHLGVSNSRAAILCMVFNILRISLWKFSPHSKVSTLE